MSNLPHPINNAIEALSGLPGIGNRSAERLVFNLLRNETHLDQKIADSLKVLKESISECTQCHNYCEVSKNTEISDLDQNTPQLCPICANPRRDTKTICIVESPIDLIALERTGEYQGVYHVLHGILSPINKIGPDQIRAQSLFDRINNTPQTEEIVFALAGNVESEATAHFLSNGLKPFFQGKLAHLARGIPTGGDLDYLDAGTLSRALLDRRVF